MKVEALPFYELLTPNYRAWVEDFAKWEEIRPRLEALKADLDFSNRTNNRDRSSRRLNKEIAELTAIIHPLQPPCRCLWNEALVLVDVWKEFVIAWRNLQLQHSIPISPAGEAIEQSSDDEKWAWDQLIRSVYGPANSKE